MADGEAHQKPSTKPSGKRVQGKESLGARHVQLKLSNGSICRDSVVLTSDNMRRNTRAGAQLAVVVELIKNPITKPGGKR